MPGASPAPAYGTGVTALPHFANEDTEAQGSK